METADGLIRKVDLRKTALAAGKPRAQAWVLAILGYWEQYEGGVVIGNQTYRWRKYSEISEETGFSEKTIGRAIASLVSDNLVSKRRIWNPEHSGQSVNAFALTKAARLLLGLDSSSSH